MSQELRSASGRLITIQQDDGNFVVYGPGDRAVFDEWSHFAQQPLPTKPPPPEPQGPLPPAGGAGGFVEHSTSTLVRPRPTDDELFSIPSRGSFRMWHPYNTRAFRITNETDGHVRPNGMAYWPVINNHGGQSVFRVIVSCDDVLTLFLVDKGTGVVTKIGPLPFHTTGEGCYWSLRHPNVLYVPSDSRLIMYDVVTYHGGDAFHAGPGTEVHQVHSSADGQVHSMTLNGQPAVARHGEIERFTAHDFDECQIDKSGRWLLIKAGADNHIVDLTTGAIWIIDNKAGAVGHSDMGWGCMVGEDDHAAQPGAFRLWHFTPDGPVDGGIVYHMIGWDGMTRYVSVCSAVEGRPDAQRVLISSAHEGDLPRANELVSVRLDGSLLGRVLGPNLADLRGLDAGSDALYWAKTRAALCPTGDYVAFSGNAHGRIDVFVCELSSG